MSVPKLKDLAYYLSLSWTFTVEQEKDEECGTIYIARVVQWQSVVTDAPYKARALEDI